MFLTTVLFTLFTLCLSDCPIVLNKSNNSLNKKTVRIMQYNVEWLFINEYNECPGDGCAWNNQTDALVHLSYVSQAISEVNPDIVNVCEVEGCDELGMLTDELEDRGSLGFKGFIKEGTDTSTGQNVG